MDFLKRIEAVLNGSNMDFENLLYWTPTWAFKEIFDAYIKRLHGEFFKEFLDPPFRIFLWIFEAPNLDFFLKNSKAF